MEIKKMNVEGEMEMAQVCNREYKVLIVGYDVQSLIMLDEMLQSCGYNVTKFQDPKMLISMLEEDEDLKRFDIIIIDLHMPDKNNGFEIITSIVLKMDLLVITMISDYNEDVIRKGIMCGACDYLLKPIRVEFVRDLWKHVYRKKTQHCLSNKGVERSGERSSSDNITIKESRNNNANLSIIEDHNHGNGNGNGNGNGTRKKKNDATSTRNNKGRIVWTTELHQKFMDACNQLGKEKATPKRIVDIMNEPTLSRASVASHLQKHRQRRKRPLSHHQNSSSLSTSTSISSHDLEPQANCRASSSNSNSQIEVPELVEMRNNQPQPIHHTWDFEGNQNAASCTNMNYPYYSGHFQEAILNQILETTNEFDLIRQRMNLNSELQVMQNYLQCQKRNELYSQRQSNLHAQAFPTPASVNSPSQIYQYTWDNANGLPMPHPQLIHYPPVNNGLPMALNHNAIHPNMNYRHPHHFEGGQQYGSISHTSADIINPHALLKVDDATMPNQVNITM